MNGTVGKLATLSGRVYSDWIPVKARRHIFSFTSRIFGREQVLIACLPKSGSTYFAKWLGCSPKFVVRSLVPAHGMREQVVEESLAWMLRQTFSKKHSVYQHHSRANEELLRVCEVNHIGIIVLTRNILDACVSIHDHIQSDENTNPIFHIERDDWESMDEYQRYLFLSEFAMPWYVEFVAGWLYMAIHSPVPVVFLSYPQVIADTQAVQEALAEIGVSVDIKELEIARIRVKSEQTRLNVGVSGRGARLVVEFPFVSDRINALINARPCRERDRLRAVLFSEL